MYGVVLWCSDDSRKAVIWCEDHGDLAYGQDIDGETALEAGDLVLFQAEQTRRMRLAREIRLVDQSRFATLPDRLKSASQPRKQRGGAQVVAFNPAAKHGRRTMSATTPVAAVL